MKVEPGKGAGGSPREAGFFALLAERVRENRSLLCVGIDPPLDSLSAGELESFGRRIVDATRDSACLYKPNIAFYEARGPEGLAALGRTVAYIHSAGFPVLLDAKRGDVSSTAEAYARAVFDVWGADAVTVNPLLGGDAIQSFASRAGRGVFVLCHTSNPGARDLQELDTGGMPLYERIALLALAGNAAENIGLVIGATYPEVLRRVRRIAPDMWFLLPGIGSQGGDLAESLDAGLDSRGGGVLVNVSRGISSAPDPGRAAAELKDRINEAREARRSNARVEGGRDEAEAEAIALGLAELGAVRFGQFTLKSGKKSPLYIDLRLLVSSPALMTRVARAMAGLLSGLAYDRIAAIPYGGLPIGQAVSLQTGKPLVYPRREVKEYGTRKAIEGQFIAGETVVVLDDLVTTGASKLEAIEPLTQAGLSVRDVVVLVDREQGGARELGERGLALHSVLTLSSLLDALVRAGRITAEVRAEARAALSAS